jgi:4-carboxymuconolactone decarboxylase
MMKTFLTLLLTMPLVTLSSDGLAQEQAKSLIPDSKLSATISHETTRLATQGADDRFTGRVRITSLFPATPPSRVTGGQVTFEPGARTAWHTHPMGQTLIVTAGTGRIQFWGGSIREIKTGDVVSIPPGVKHWHGASPGSSMTHLAIQEEIDGKTADWLEKVTDVQYGANATQTNMPATANSSRAQQLLGDVSPKLAELTDTVLFGDIWERPGLSKRDRSLVTVSALVAMNRPDQLRSHLALAQQNGLTREELAEAITHLAFYTGWPSAVTAVSVAKDVLPVK